MKPLLFVLAWISFALGVIGAFLPILPTTPFLILSTYLFSKSSPRFHAWILNLPIAGAAVKDWQTNRVIKTKAKILCATMITLSCTMIWLHGNIPMLVKFLVSSLLISVGLYVVSQKSHV